MGSSLRVPTGDERQIALTLLEAVGNLGEPLQSILAQVACGYLSRETTLIEMRRLADSLIAALG